MAVGLKICGITRAQDLDACERSGVDAVGLNFWRKSPRGLSIEAAEELLAGRAGGPKRIGVFVDPDEAALRAAWERLGLDAVQLHGDEPIARYAALGIPYVWVVRGTPDLSTLRPPRPSPLWILIDAAGPGFGGVGRLADWSFARAAVERLAPVPVWLAGGITPENARAAIERAAPAGLDVASGAERPGAAAGEKDPTVIARLARICQTSSPP